MDDQIEKSRRKIKILIRFFIIGLILSGITAFPLEWELSMLNNLMVKYFGIDNPLHNWIQKVYHALKATNNQYPFLAYGTDWLAFAHIVIAIAFIGPLRDPVKNIWIIEFGMIACVLIIPLALIAGEIRQIPVYWRIIDCCFGAIGIIPLLICHREIKKLENYQNLKTLPQ